MTVTGTQQRVFRGNIPPHLTLSIQALPFSYVIFPYNIPTGQPHLSYDKTYNVQFSNNKFASNIHIHNHTYNCDWEHARTAIDIYLFLKFTLSMNNDPSAAIPKSLLENFPDFGFSIFTEKYKSLTLLPSDTAPYNTVLYCGNTNPLSTTTRYGYKWGTFQDTAVVQQNTFNPKLTHPPVINPSTGLYHTYNGPTSIKSHLLSEWPAYYESGPIAFNYHSTVQINTGFYHPLYNYGTTDMTIDYEITDLSIYANNTTYTNLAQFRNMNDDMSAEYTYGVGTLHFSSGN